MGSLLAAPNMLIGGYRGVCPAHRDLHSLKHSLFNTDDTSGTVTTPASRTGSMALRVTTFPPCLLGLVSSRALHPLCTCKHAPIPPGYLTPSPRQPIVGKRARATVRCARPRQEMNGSALVGPLRASSFLCDPIRCAAPPVSCRLISTLPVHRSSVRTTDENGIAPTARCLWLASLPNLLFCEGTTYRRTPLFALPSFPRFDRPQGTVEKEIQTRILPGCLEC